jgi:hypothetical protein
MYKHFAMGQKELLDPQNQNTATPGKSTCNRSFISKDNSIDDPSQTTQEPMIYRHLARYMVTFLDAHLFLDKSLLLA